MQLNGDFLPLHLLDTGILVLPIVLTFWLSKRSSEVGIPDVNEEGIDILEQSKQALEAGLAQAADGTGPGTKHTAGRMWTLRCRVLQRRDMSLGCVPLLCR